MVNMETGVPVRDVLVYTDNGQGAKTAWDGTFRIEKAFRRVSFTHGGYVKRIMDVEEMQGDTIALLPNMLAMGEVVIWGHRRNMTASIIPKPSKTDLQLQQAVPQGFNPLGLLFKDDYRELLRLFLCFFLLLGFVGKNGDATIGGVANHVVDNAGDLCLQLRDELLGIVLLCLDVA